MTITPMIALALAQAKAGKAPREAYASAQRDVKIIRSQKTGATEFRTLYEQYRNPPRPERGEGTP